jgi:nucleoside phosphorylase
VDALVEKARVRERLDSGRSLAVLEMETYALARALQDKGIPLMGLRAVSDEWDFDPAPVVRHWTDHNLQIRSQKVTRDVLRHPGRMALLWGLYRRSRVAAASLAVGVRAILDP